MSSILETRRLSLREMSLADLDFIATLLDDPQVMRFYPQRYSRDEAIEWIERQMGRYEDYGHGLWLVEKRSDGQPIGQVGLSMQRVDDVAEPEIGYMIHRPFWRQGYASEAAAGVRDWALDTRGLRRVVSLILPANIPSQRVALKIGMKPEKMAPHAGNPHLVFALNR